MVFLTVAVLLVGVAAQGATGLASRTAWTGTYVLPRGATPVVISLALSGQTMSLSLSPGHAADDTVRVQTSGHVIRFRIPGRPNDISFVGRIRRTGVSGTVRQGGAVGTFRLHRVRRATSASLGLYATSTGGGLLVADYRRLGLPRWLIDLDTGAFHGLYGSGTTLTVGATLATKNPPAGRLSLLGDRLALTDQSGRLEAPRVAWRQYEVRFPSRGAVMAGTLTIPATPGPHPAVAAVHGSGPALRDEAQFLTGLLVRHGIAVLAYDKRGVGQSGGAYPGEFPTDKAVNTYARDAEAALRFLSRQPDLAPTQLGLVGGSQAGWIVPLAAVRSGLASFAILESGPTVTVGETSAFSDRTTQGEAPLSKPLSEIEAEVEQIGPSGFDPKPLIRQLQIPILWLYGGLDMNQPSHLDAKALERLKAETGHDYSWRVFPDGNHGIFEVRTGLNSEVPGSRGMPPEFFSVVAGWLHDHHIGLP